MAGTDIAEEECETAECSGSHHGDSGGIIFQPIIISDNEMNLNREEEEDGCVEGTKENYPVKEECSVYTIQAPALGI